MERPGGTERQDLFVSRLGPGRLYELAGEDMRFCLDMAGRRPGGLRELDFVTAAIQLLPALGISGAAWRDAVDTMGDFRAALCVLITDANRDHPVTPIRKPGGHLRGLTRRHQAGQLNLVGSLMGLAERRDTE
jgi:replication initiation protein RepC